MVKKPCDCGFWLVPFYTNIISCFVEDLNNQHSGSCLELLYDPSGVVVMSQLMMDVHFWKVQLTEAADGFPFAGSARGGVSGSLDQLLQAGSSDIIFFLVKSHAVMMSASVLFHLIPWNRHFSWSALCVGTASSRGASIVLLKLGAPKQQCRDWLTMVWALLGSVTKFLVVSACVTDVLLSQRRGHCCWVHGEGCADPYLGKGRKADLFLPVLWDGGNIFMYVFGNLRGFEV